MGPPVGRVCYDRKSAKVTKILNMELDSVIRSVLDNVLVRDAER
jgi:hypothetical protein